MRIGSGFPPKSPGAVLVAAPKIPEPDTESGSRRTFDIIHFFLTNGWNVTLAIPGPPSVETRRAWDDLGVEVVAASGQEFDRRIESTHFSLAWIAFWQVADALIPTLRTGSPTTRIVVDSVDLHFLRRSRERLQVGDPVRYLSPDHGLEFSRELNAYASADAVVTVSDREASLLEDLLGSRVPLLCLPDAEELPRFPRSFGERRGMLFVGSFRHPPNRDGLSWLCESVLPRLDQRLRSEHPLVVVGLGADSELQARIGKVSGVEFVGWAPSLEPYLEGCRISVVPLRYGAGTKRKLIQSAMAGLPSVSTPIGVEGLALGEGVGVLVAERAETFAASVGLLLQDQALWERLSRGGRRAILRRHHRNRVQSEFENIVARVLQLKARSFEDSLPKDWLLQWLRQSYPILTERLRTAVAAVVPDGSKVAVVSKGDPALLRMGNREGVHFPRQADGLPAGFHPPDSNWALSHLRELFRTGVRFLVLPAVSFWWLDHYRCFGNFLAERSVLLFDDADTGRIYDLRSMEDAAWWQGGDGL